MKYAGFWRRSAALFVDVMALGALGEILGQILLVAFGGETERGIYAWGVGHVVVHSFSWLYFALMESSNFHATLGKLFFDIRVVSLDGEVMTFKHAVVRNLCKYISALPLFFGFFMAGFTSKKQALHDIISKSLVIDKPGHQIKFD
ncbi:MAG: RDD family protein [Spirochaetes bacterium]|jgi:uncharacterized RDD family membrane protein YckC|nr:RDD family protein [Spirochaetota bacterium]